MREILFRGKRTDNGEWIEGYYFRSEQLHFIILSNSTGSFNQGVCCAHIDYCYNVLPETVGKHTGLADKNKHPVFEGDIIKYDGRYGKVVYWPKYAKFIVVFPDWFTDFGYHLMPEYFEVVGNIFDNAELLKGATK